MNHHIYSWDDGYAIGVESIDSAHKELFSVVARLEKLIHEQGRDRWACIQGVKYFKHYAAMHFADEERFMLSEGYPHLEEHKKIHTELRTVTLPKIENEMKSSNFSVESVENFLFICSEWLANHIAKEDRKILLFLASKYAKEEVLSAESNGKVTGKN